MSDSNFLPQVLSLADGEIVGRIRMQKIIFLLDRLGMNSDLEYEYHHFGPYSDELSSLIYFSRSDGVVEEKFGHRIQDGARYSIFKLVSDPGEFSDLGGLSKDKAKELVQKFISTNSTVLELAATIEWLRVFEGLNDWKDELKRRKPSKASDKKMEEAQALLDEIGLPA